MGTVKKELQICEIGTYHIEVFIFDDNGISGSTDVWYLSALTEEQAQLLITNYSDAIAIIPNPSDATKRLHCMLWEI